jgi:hypothetical protein
MTGEKVTVGAGIRAVAGTTGSNTTTPCAEAPLAVNTTIPTASSTKAVFRNMDLPPFLIT